MLQTTERAGANNGKPSQILTESPQKQFSLELLAQFSWSVQDLTAHCELQKAPLRCPWCSKGHPAGGLGRLVQCGLGSASAAAPPSGSRASSEACDCQVAVAAPFVSPYQRVPRQTTLSFTSRRYANPEQTKNTPPCLLTLIMIPPPALPGRDPNSHTILSLRRGSFHSAGIFPAICPFVRCHRLICVQQSRSGQPAAPEADLAAASDVKHTDQSLSRTHRRRRRRWMKLIFSCGEQLRSSQQEEKGARV